MTTATLQQNREALIERAWAQLPASYRIPEVAPTLQEARLYSQKACFESHLREFHRRLVRFLPQGTSPRFHALYAYCRISDDLGDEVDDPAQALLLLDVWGRELDACFEGRARHPVFVALSETLVRSCSIPKEPFGDLLTAFRQDQSVMRYASMKDVLGYCRNSANPVGRLVLYACGEADAERFRLSDATCTALQLANFWQDVRRDYAKGRVYLPQDDMQRFGVGEDTIARGLATPEFCALLRHEVAAARVLFDEGLPLIGMVGRDLSLDLELFSRGGLAILDAIERQDYDVLGRRPNLSKGTKVKLALLAVAGRALPLSAGRWVDWEAKGGMTTDTKAGQRRPGRRHTPCAEAVAKSKAKRTSTTPLSPCSKPRGATPSARSMPLCARPTTSRTTRASRGRNAACAWKHGWRSGGASKVARTPTTRSLSPCATPW